MFLLHLKFMTLSSSLNNPEVIEAIEGVYIVCQTYYWLWSLILGELSNQNEISAQKCSWPRVRTCNVVAWVAKIKCNLIQIQPPCHSWHYTLGITTPRSFIGTVHYMSARFINKLCLSEEEEVVTFRIVIWGALNGLGVDFRRCRVSFKLHSCSSYLAHLSMETFWAIEF